MIGFACGFFFGLLAGMIFAAWLEAHPEWQRKQS